MGIVYVSMWEFIAGLLVDVFVVGIGKGIRYMGAWVRWVLIGKDKDFEEVLGEDWNRRVGWFLVCLIVLAVLTGTGVLTWPQS